MHGKILLNSLREIKYAFVQQKTKFNEDIGYDDI